MSLKNDVRSFMGSCLPGDTNIESTFTDLSKDTQRRPLVNNNTVAFNMDYISRKLFGTGQTHCSTDALHITTRLNLIEFKRNIFGQDFSQQVKRSDIQRKMYSSLILLEKIILPNSLSNGNVEIQNIDYIIVVDSITNPNVAVAGAMRSLAAGFVNVNTQYFTHFERVNFNYNGRSTRIFFDNVYIWNDINFNININRC